MLVTAKNKELILIFFEENLIIIKEIKIRKAAEAKTIIPSLPVCLNTTQANQKEVKNIGIPII